MAPVLALAMLCVSPTLTFDRMTIANRLPAYCDTFLGSPPLPVSLPAAVAPPEPVPVVENQ